MAARGLVLKSWMSRTLDSGMCPKTAAREFGAVLWRKKRPSKVRLIPRGLAACKTLANKRPVASRRETASTQFNPSSEALLQPIRFQQKKCSDGKQDVPLGQKYKNGF